MSVRFRPPAPIKNQEVIFSSLSHSYPSCHIGPEVRGPSVQLTPIPLVVSIFPGL